MEERRKLPRKYLVAFSSVREKESGAELGYLCDMNLDGMMVISKNACKTGKELELCIELPEENDFPQKKITVKAQLVWCKADVDPRLYNIGFKFINLGEKDKAIIQKMIELYEFRRDIELFPPSVLEMNQSIQR